jgi:glycosyltransferase involved in cell wall biosynthesis
MDVARARIGLLSTRLAGTDGVSLEVLKWVTVLEGLGYECFFFAGESDWPPDRTELVPEAHFTHPEIVAINKKLFDERVRSHETSQRVQILKDYLKLRLDSFIHRFKLNLLIAQNVLSLPMNVPLGLALTEVIAETGIPTIGHHHDFTWERSRFAVNAATDYLQAAFPPTLHSIRHVVINSFAARQLAMRAGASSTLIPNVMPFEETPPQPDEYSADLRATLEVQPDEYMLLQPTRIVPRKRIERAIELACRLELPCVLVISHKSGDEGHDYANYLQNYARLMGARVIFGSDHIDHNRGRHADGQPIYSLADIYLRSDLVTYPSAVEGFGNAFLESIYYRRPIVMSTYEIFKTDIQTKGFKVVAFDGFVTDETVRDTCNLLQNPNLVTEAVEHNYQLGRRFYSYQALEKRLVALLNESLGT